MGRKTKIIMKLNIIIKFQDTMKKITLLLMLSIMSLTLTQCSKSEEVSPKENKKEKTDPKKATLNVSITGITDFSDIKCVILDSKNAVIEEKDANSSVNFNIDKYISKDIKVKIKKEISNKSPLILNESDIINIKEGTNNIKLNIIQKADLNVSITGITDFSNIKVIILDTNNVIIEQKDAKSDIKFNVSKYIYKDIKVWIEKKIKNEDPLILKESDIINIKEGTNNINLKTKENKYIVKIKVLKGNKPLKNAIVYAVDQVNSLAVLINTQNLTHDKCKSLKKQTTNDKGVAIFQDLSKNVNPLANKYHFFVITKEGTILSNGKYKEVTLSLNGEEQNGTITLEKEKSIDLSIINPYGNLDFKISLLNNKDEIIDNKTISLSDNSTKKITFGNLKKGTYKITGNAGNYYSIEKKDIIINNESTPEIVYANIIAKAKLILNCTSKSPYYVTIKDSDGKKIKEFVIKGKTKETLYIPIGKYKVDVKQKSGYLVYPTEKSFNVDIESGYSSTCTFP